MVSSYQTLARYNDLERQPNRMPDMRQQMRDDLDVTRYQTRLMQRLRLRGICDERSEEDDEDSIYHGEAYDEVDYYADSTDLGNYNPGDTQQFIVSSDGWPCTPPPSNAPSPSLSNESTYSNGWGCPSLCDTPERKPRARPNQNRTRKDILRQRKRVQQVTYSSEAIKQRYITLKTQVVNLLHDPNAVGRVICSSWHVLDDAMKDDDELLIRDSLHFLTELISCGYIQVVDALFMLQQGLMLSLNTTLSRSGSHPIDIVNLLQSIIVSEPRATPYVTELMRATGVINQLDEILVFGCDQDISALIRFYHDIFERSLAHLTAGGRFIPVVPENLVMTSTCDELEKTYSPLSTLMILANPKLIYQLISRFFTHIGGHSLGLTRLAMKLCAWSLNLAEAYMNSASQHGEWARSVFRAFDEWNLEQLIVKHLESSHLSKVEREVMEAFLAFYQELYIAITKLKMK